MNSTDVLEEIKTARLNGDFDLVKRLSKQQLENPRISDEDRVGIMDQIAHMYLDLFLIWVNEMKKIDPDVDKYGVLRNIAQNLEDDPNVLQWYTPYMRQMRDAEPEELINNFLSVEKDDAVEKAKEAMKKEGL